MVNKMIDWSSQTCARDSAGIIYPVMTARAHQRARRWMSLYLKEPANISTITVRCSEACGGTAALVWRRLDRIMLFVLHSTTLLWWAGNGTVSWFHKEVIFPTKIPLLPATLQMCIISVGLSRHIKGRKDLPFLHLQKWHCTMYIWLIFVVLHAESCFWVLINISVPVALLWFDKPLKR